MICALYCKRYCTTITKILSDIFTICSLGYHRETEAVVVVLTVQSIRATHAAANAGNYSIYRASSIVIQHTGILICTTAICLLCAGTSKMARTVGSCVS
jgi:hypothetical protein